MRRRTARRIIACIWLFSMTISLPWALFFTLVPYPIDGYTIQVCAEEWPNEQMGKIYFVCANLILLYLFPAFVIIFCYLGIWYKIERRNIPGDGAKGLKIELIMQKSKLKVVKMMMLVVVIFLLSWLPLYLIFARVKLADEHYAWEDWLIATLLPLAQW
jgi:neuropeptide FF receptor 2